MKTKMCNYEVEVPVDVINQREEEIDYLMALLKDKMNSRWKKLQYGDIKDIEQILRYCIARNKN